MRANFFYLRVIHINRKYFRNKKQLKIHKYIFNYNYLLVQYQVNSKDRERNPVADLPSFENLYILLFSPFIIAWVFNYFFVIAYKFRFIKSILTQLVVTKDHASIIHSQTSENDALRILPPLVNVSYPSITHFPTCSLYEL